MSLHKSSPGFPKLGGIQTATAGTTQTQAGATAITKPIVAVTTGNANDGVSLPRGDYQGAVDQCVIVENKSAVILKVYPFYDTVAAAGDGSTVDGGAANAAFSQPASTTYIYSLDSRKTWKVAKLS